VEAQRTICVEVRGEFSPEMERLRREYSDHDWPGGMAADEFDECSSHLVASVDGEPAGMVRVTRRPPSPLAAWAMDPETIPRGEGVYEPTRGVVGRRWRGLGLYKLLMAEATRHCYLAGAARLVAAIHPDFAQRDFLHRIGFEAVGPVIRMSPPPEIDVLAQVIVQDPAASLAAAQAACCRCIDGLSGRGFRVRSQCVGGSGPIREVRDGGVLTLTLDRPDKLNALSAAMVRELIARVRLAQTDATIRVVALCGSGRAFCTGADLHELAADDRAAAAEFVQLGAELVELLGRLGKPVVAAVGGHALGGGLEFALGCTIRIASDRATFGLPEVRLGLMPGWGGTQRLARLCGPSRAALLALTGEPIDAGTALSWGLVDRVVPHDRLDKSVASVCHQIAGYRREAVAGILSSVGHAGGDPTDGLEREAGLFRELFLLPDTPAGISAFFGERRTRRCT
jgi:enoyl-CoA hydratase